MSNQDFLASLVQQYQYGINSLPFAVDFVKENFSERQIQTISPYSFTIGSNNNNEGLSYEFEQENALFFGNLYININPNGNDLQNEEIVLKYRSYWNSVPYMKHITRQVEIENLINENSVSNELFDLIELEQLSTKYDLYVTFVGFIIHLR